jgi:hypothetical protein
VISVDAYSLANPADLAVGAVVDILRVVVIVKLADVAVVVRQAATICIRLFEAIDEKLR